MQGKNVKNASELHSRQLRFWMQKSRKCAHNFFCNLAMWKLPRWSELHSKPLRFWTHNSWNCAQNFFCKTCRQRTSKMRLNFTANTFIFGRKNRENAARTFLTCKVKTSKIRLDFMASSFVFAHKTCENAPKTFLWTLEADNSKNISELHGKQLCCETQKLGKCAQNFFINLATGEFPNNVWTFNMLWPENGFNRENMSRTSLKKYLN